MANKNKNEVYAEKWFEKNGFEYKLIKQYYSKTIYELSKDGLTYRWELPFGVTEMKSYMNFCKKDHDMMIKIEQLKKELKK